MAESVTVALNKKARFDYTIGDTFEAGLVLTGTEVKSLREGGANIKDAYATIEEGELWLINSYIKEYKMGNCHNHAPRRKRKLLLNRREIKKLIGLLKTKGVTIVPLALYFNRRGIAKVEIGVATGKRKHEKREVIKERDWKREQGRALKGEME